MEERSSNLENGKGFTPSFYRMIMPSVVRERRLVLPKNFVEENGDELSSTIELDLPAGGKWYIGLNKMCDLVFLHDGWENFMNHYSIRFGSLLLFKYRGNSVFHVHIFDLTATEIQYPPVCRNCNLGKSSQFGKKNLLMQKLEKTKVVDAEKMYKTVNPSFNVTLKDRDVTGRYNVNLPREFMRKHMHGCPEFIKIVDSDKMWHIRCVKYGDWTSLGKGWSNFVKEKGLKIGDVCVFELVKKKAILKVDVFYAKRRNK